MPYSKRIPWRFRYGSPEPSICGAFQPAFVHSFCDPATVLLMVLSVAQNERGYVPVHVACERLGVSPWTLYRWLQQKKLRGVRPGHRWLVSVEDIDRLMTPAA